MKEIFDKNSLLEVAEENANSFRNAKPFPYIIIDNFLDSETVEKVERSFPRPKDMEFYVYDNPLEKKLAFDQITKLPKEIGAVLRDMNSPTFLNFLENLTGIQGLISDPYYRGGGIHQSINGGKLDIHVDFNLHPKINLHRRLNSIIFLNRDWKEEYGGHLELWEGHKNKKGEHMLKEKAESILPIYNRLVIFETSEKSYHGFPDPITCPKETTRKSLATYYYTVPSSALDFHSTTYVGRPGEKDDPELESLRKKRNKGRLHSNIDGIE